MEMSQEAWRDELMAQFEDTAENATVPALSFVIEDYEEGVLLQITDVTYDPQKDVIRITLSKLDR